MVGLHSVVVALSAGERRLRPQFKLPLTATHICEPSQRSHPTINPTKLPGGLKMVTPRWGLARLKPAFIEPL